MICFIKFFSNDRLYVKKFSMYIFYEIVLLTQNDFVQPRLIYVNWRPGKLCIVIFCVVSYLAGRTNSETIQGSCTFSEDHDMIKCIGFRKIHYTFNRLKKISASVKRLHQDQFTKKYIYFRSLILDVRSGFPLKI